MALGTSAAVKRLQALLRYATAPRGDSRHPSAANVPAPLVALYRGCFAMMIPDAIIALKLENAAQFVRTMATDRRFSEGEQTELVALADALHFWSAVLEAKPPWTP